MRAYIDADILIWHLRGEKKSVDFLRKLHKSIEYELWIGAMQRAEVLFFTRSEEEDKTLQLLSQFKTASVDQECVDVAASLYRQWNHSFGIDANDAILAATAQLKGGKIYCLNTKHYPMPNIIAEKPW